MRTVIAGLLALAVLVGWAAAAPAAPARARAAKPARMLYVCPTCGVGASFAIACPVCGKPMGRVATYVCLKDQISADVPGPCPECHQPMKQLASLYKRCPTCHFYYLKSKKVCPVCAKRHKLHQRKPAAWKGHRR